MIAFDVKDMFSSRSAGAIIKSVKAVDSGAQVRVNMQTRVVEIDPISALPGQLSEAIGKAGFTPTPVVDVDLFLPLD